MHIMQMVAHVSLSYLHNEILGFEGPYYRSKADHEFVQSAVIWLKNGYGVNISKGDNPLQVEYCPMASDMAELLVVRETNAGSVHDYDNPVTSDVLKSVTVEEIIEALRKLSELTNDPDDLTERPPPF